MLKTLHDPSSDTAPSSIVIDQSNCDGSTRIVEVVLPSHDFHMSTQLGAVSSQQQQRLAQAPEIHSHDAPLSVEITPDT
ncbi:hypothetical protein P3T76_008751 [Phytophthora citrophthora]|uniref:Uncharacterized protein n=1 Tax=Phytophthora citrophthora TaxID=4793 RepID=A0AAD9LKR0_9STRA|nr:hypothetical protein P3T76_008751 [Phytophthora citrophthora]